ncbi:protein-L-isoaspartate(D-aspartate) O-methyltransferase [Candidatus Thorarchaeota archaeon]|nr:MAG: protein-L-isoaspartate(D-aspartate) O-methyltransferase [Candidatus Thorarchaeota archaeon]
MSKNPQTKAIDNLIRRLRSSGYLTSDEMERALRLVPREEFVHPSNREHAYRDTPLSIGHGQTISAPHMCVIMCEALRLRPGHRILEIGAGSGYHAALCAELVAPKGTATPGHVFTIEIVESLITFARRNLERTGYADKVTLIQGDGGKGLPEEAPFDRILVAAAAPDIPQPLTEQLAKEGIMLIPVGSRGFFQDLFMITKDNEGRISRRNWGGVAFVPLTGEFGY